MKPCSTCGIVKPFDEYYRDKRATDGRYCSCKPCQRDKTAAWRARNVERYRDTQARWRAANPDALREMGRRYYWTHRHGPWLKYRYGITLAEYDRMLAEQGGVCAICQRPPTAHIRARRLSVDHDHGTGRVRGLLCDACNRGIGSIPDPTWLQNAASYLERATAATPRTPARRVDRGVTDP